MERYCKHKVPLSEVCERCTFERAREARETAYDRQTRRISGELLHRYRMGEFDRLPEGDHLAGVRDPGMRRYWDDVRSEFAEMWSRIWRERRERGSQRRKEWVESVLRGEWEDRDRPFPLTPGWLEFLLGEHSGKLTPAQREALVLTWGKQLSQREAADVARCTRGAYRKRLRGAERAASIILDAVAKGRPSTVRRGRNAGRATVVTEGTGHKYKGRKRILARGADAAPRA